MIADSQKQIDDYKSKQMSKDKQRELENQRLLDEAMKKKVLLYSTISVVKETLIRPLID